MNKIDLDTWEDFEGWISKLDGINFERRMEGGGRYVSKQLYRGQSNSKWDLTTSLERYISGSMTMEEYYRVLRATKPQVETFTGLTWDMPSLIEYKAELGDESYLLPGTFPAYDYFVHLRHRGFPSPLLDWTQSPYVAAYFAFGNAVAYEKTDSASIYVYCEYITGHKSGSSNRPKITELGPYVRGHQRHFQQQSQYTICTVRQDNEHWYTPHQGAFDSNKDEPNEQDELWQFNIPIVTERTKILKQLERYNINAFSLFGSEESLMEALAFRELP